MTVPLRVIKLYSLNSRRHRASPCQTVNKPLKLIGNIENWTVQTVAFRILSNFQSKIPILPILGKSDKYPGYHRVQYRSGYRKNASTGGIRVASSIQVSGPGRSFCSSWGSFQFGSGRALQTESRANGNLQIAFTHSSRSVFPSNVRCTRWQLCSATRIFTEQTVRYKSLPFSCAF